MREPRIIPARLVIGFLGTVPEGWSELKACLRIASASLTAPEKGPLSCSTGQKSDYSRYVRKLRDYP